MFRKTIASSVAVFLALWAAVLVVAPVQARETSVAAPALWKIDGPDGDIYFFGSIHLLPKGVTWRRPELDAALKQAQQLVFELDMDAARDPKGKSLLVAKHGFLGPEESLHKMLAPEHRERLDAVAKSLGLEPDSIDRMRPWLAAITLNSLAIIKQNSKPAPPAGGEASPTMSDAPGVDAQLWAWSKAVGKTRGVLETAEDQIRVFADLSREHEIEFLTVTLQDVKRTPETLGSMIEAWRVGDTARLDKAFNASMEPVLRKAVLRDRHEKWLPQIERMMSDGGTHVIVVGAAHLVGEDSVIAMLRDKGVTVEGP